VTSKVEYRKRCSEELLLGDTKRLLRHLGIKARKSLGQHFLIDEEVLKVVVSAAELIADDVVMEIGPGLGVLTKELARRAGWVITVELDSSLAAALRQTLSSLENITVVDGDILKLEPVALLQEQKITGYKIVANLPYYITSAVLRHFLEAKFPPQIMVVMVQKEVAEAIVAKPGRMNLLSVSVQLYGEPKIVSYVSAGCFYPPPEVSSAILKVVLYPQPMVAVDEREGFFGLVRAGFCASRKQLVNSLAQGLGLSKDCALSLLEMAAIIPKRRAETLAIVEWVQLWQVYKRVKD